MMKENKNLITVRTVSVSRADNFLIVLICFFLQFGKEVYICSLLTTLRSLILQLVFTLKRKNFHAC
jgi:hypothetical protein